MAKMKAAMAAVRVLGKEGLSQASGGPGAAININVGEPGDALRGDGVDTPAATDPAFEAQRHAYNAAFEELDLAWHWDAVTYERLIGHGCGVRRYLETERPHLLRAYHPDFLVAAVEAVKARRLGGARA